MNDEASEVKSETAAGRLAAEIKERRVKTGLSQADLADTIGYTRQYASLAEQHGKDLPSAALTKAIDDALGAGGAIRRLHAEAVAEKKARRAGSDGSLVIPADLLPTIEPDLDRLRRVLNARDLQEAGWARPVPLLALAVSKLTGLRLQARYVQIAREVPGLLAELLSVTPADTAEDQAVNRALTLAYRAADGVAFKFGHTDLSSRIIDLMRQVSERTNDAALVASVEYVGTETFFADGDLDTGHRALVQAMDRLPHKAAAAGAGAAAFGSLHMRAAVVAARLGEPDSARDHLTEARSIASRLPEGVYDGTAFGPESVKVHDVAVNVELGDAPTAVARVGDWEPSQVLPAERRSHYFIDLARALVDVGRVDRAQSALRSARQIAPQHVRQHPHVRQAVLSLRKRHGQDTELKDFAHWMGIIRP